MTLTHMILREVQRSKLNTFLCLLTVVIATGLLVAMIGVSRASVEATRIMMKEMGFNLLVTPTGVDPARYQALDFQDIEMPEDYVSRLANSTVLARHFVGKYQKTIQLNGCTLVLTGVLPEAAGPGKQQAPMPTAYAVPEGQAFIGAVAARALGLKEGDSLAVLGASFTVGKVLSEAGVIPDDIRVYTHLHDMQKLIGRPGRVNAIDALACECNLPAADVVGALERGIKQVLPDVQVEPYRSILLARHEQRKMVSRLALLTLAVVMAASATAIWVLTYQNVRRRRREIGVLRALGISDVRIGALFFGKIIVYSLAGSVLGYALGYAAAVRLSLAEVQVAVSTDVLLTLLLVTPFVAMVFGLSPILGGLLQEPAELMRDEMA